jgi:hypothetical protein
MSASSLYDTLRVNESKVSDEPEFTARDRQFVDIIDSQNSYYGGGQITFDLNSLTSSSSFLDWKSSYITLPIKMTLETPGTETSMITPVNSNNFALSLKNSNFSLISGINVSCANQTVVTTQSMSNIPITYKLLTSFNSVDEAVLGPSIGFAKDNSDSMTWSNTVGELNNNVQVGTTASLDSLEPINTGRVKRSKNATISTLNTLLQTTNATIAAGSNPQNLTNLTNTLRGICTVNTCTGSNTADGGTVGPQVITYTMLCTIPMRYLHDMFDKMPLMRGALWQMTITTHLPSTWTGRLTADGNWSNMNPVTPFQFCPFMVTSGQTIHNSGTSCGLMLDEDWAPPDAGATNILIKCVIGNQAQAQCILHCAMYDLSHEVAQSYIAEPRKTCVYEDFIRCAPSGMQNVAATGIVTCNITPGLGKLRGMLIAPYLPATSTGIFGNGSIVGISSLNSPFTSAGATCAPMAILDNFNVMVASKPIYNKNIRYRFDAFLREQFGINAAAGNGVDGLRTGLISEYDFNTAYGYVYVNLERHLQSSDSLPVSVDVTFQNASNSHMSYNVFLFYEKEFSVDILTGKMLV